MIKPLEAHEHQLDSIAGHALLKKMTRRFAEMGAFPHAMIFHGPAGVGKKSFAYAMAKFINCVGERGSLSCGCPACRKISRQTYIDLKILKPEGSSRTIKIENIRALQETAYITPVEAHRKIVFFFEAEKMSRGAANCILKILEEPPRHLAMILITDNYNYLLPTIRSRCMNFRFSPLPVKELRDWLIKPNRVDEALAEIVAALSEGKPGVALEMARGAFHERRGAMVRELETLEKYGFAAIFRTAHKIGESSKDLHTALNDLLIWYRDLLVNRIAPDNPALLINRDFSEAISSAVSQYSVRCLYEACRTLMERQWLTQRMVPAFLVLMVILSEIGTSLKKA